MPLYEYECQDCKDRFEVIQKVDDKPVRKCGKCGGKVRRLISAPSFRFRGSGWYVTDYGKGNSSKPDQAGKGDKAEGAGEAGKKSEPGKKSGSGGDPAGK